LAKNRKFFLLPFYLAPSFRVTPSDLRKSFTDPETRVFQAADGEDLVLVFDWSTRVTDRQTDRIAMAKTRWKQ